MKLDLIQIPLADKPVLAAVMQLYLYDTSDHTGDQLNDEGRYDYSYFDLYWVESGRYPFLIRVDGQIAGLALVRTLEAGLDPLYQMAEFFIMRVYRRRGVGRSAAFALFNRFPGRWEVGQEAANTAGIAFWRRIIAEYTGGQFTETFHADAERCGPAQRFRSGSNAQTEEVGPAA